ncbi:hypothetical protein B296_00049473 [Ensete ventricosum]|uniref:Uncharacterized protein n=1 Tax=Ensete ventricosum TaxID=4639 RepID=A0A426YQJ6_ENSVE|nr:hypothetical protein B296_00049473 [Ensete ventricosum]
MDATDRSKGQISFSSRQNSVMSQISEMDSDDMDGSSSPKDDGGGGRSYLPGFPVGSWDDSSPFNNDSLPGLRGGRDGEEKMVTGLSPLELPQVPHLFSICSILSTSSADYLPRTTSEMATIEKFLQFHDAVPCKIRAKRGCATHPRSIAERIHIRAAWFIEHVWTLTFEGIIGKPGELQLFSWQAEALTDRSGRGDLWLAREKQIRM